MRHTDGTASTVNVPACVAHNRTGSPSVELCTGWVRDPASARVVTTTVPEAGAFHVHHTEWPPDTRATLGSPACCVAFMFVPSALALVPLSAEPAEKSSLAGGVVVIRKSLRSL